MVVFRVEKISYKTIHRSPMMTIRTTLMCVHQLLTRDVMNPQDPQDHVVARQLISNEALFLVDRFFRKD